MESTVASMFIGPGPIQAVRCDQSGNYMAAAQIDGRVRIFDIRTYKAVHSYNVPGRPTSLDISQRGALAVAFGTHVKVYPTSIGTHHRDELLNHCTRGSALRAVRFAAYDDILCLGHSMGLSSIVVPGSGEPNFDSFIASPFETSKQMREREVHSLLEKLQPTMISLHDVFGSVRKTKLSGGTDTTPGVVKSKERAMRSNNDDDDDDAVANARGEDDEGANNNDNDDAGEVTTSRKKRSLNVEADNDDDDDDDNNSNNDAAGGAKKPSKKRKKQPLSQRPLLILDEKRERKHDENAERAAQDAARAQARRKQLYAKSAPSALDRFKKK